MFSLDGWTGDVCIQINQIEATMNNHPIVTCNHTDWYQLNLLWQDGGESSFLECCFTQDHDNENFETMMIYIFIF